MQGKKLLSPAGLSYGSYMGKVVAITPEVAKLTGFDLFWEVWPAGRKKNKGDALKAWLQTQKVRPPIEAIIAAVNSAIASPQWQKDGGDFIPYPASWLRAWGWADE